MVIPRPLGYILRFTRVCREDLTNPSLRLPLAEALQHRTTAAFKVLTYATFIPQGFSCGVPPRFMSLTSFTLLDRVLIAVEVADPNGIEVYFC